MACYKFEISGFSFVPLSCTHAKGGEGHSCSANNDTMQFCAAARGKSVKQMQCSQAVLDLIQFAFIWMSQPYNIRGFDVDAAITRMLADILRLFGNKPGVALMQSNKVWNQMKLRVNIALDFTPVVQEVVDICLQAHPQLAGMQMEGAQFVLRDDGTVTGGITHPCARVYRSTTPEKVLGTQVGQWLGETLATRKPVTLVLGPVLKQLAQARAFAALASGAPVTDIVTAYLLSSALMEGGAVRNGIGGKTHEELYAAIAPLLDTLEGTFSTRQGMWRPLPPAPQLDAARGTAERAAAAASICARARWMRQLYWHLRDQAVALGLATNKTRADGARKLHEMLTATV